MIRLKHYCFMKRGLRMKKDKENSSEICPRIAVVGVGGAGNNAVNNMIRFGLQDVTFIACNTDAQALNQSLCPVEQRIRLGFGVTKGLGAGSSPEVGREAAVESLDEVLRHLEGYNMVFVTAGMGGGTGTGGAPVIAQAAREKGILTVGVVTKPFHFEGALRMQAAEAGIEVLKECVDTLLVIPNQNLFRVSSAQTTFNDAFVLADDFLRQAVSGFTDLMIKPGLVNLDFADICTVVRNRMGKAMMGTGEATGENRATEAAEKAIGCLLLDDVVIQGARSVLVNITGGNDLSLYEVDEAVSKIKEEAHVAGHEYANIIFGATFDPNLQGAIRVSVVATGIEPIPVAAEVTIPHTKEDFADMETHQDPQDSSEDDSLSVASYGRLGSRHSDYTFDEKHFSSFSLQEEAEEFNYPKQKREVEKERRPVERKRSFFELLTSFGRRKAPVEEAQERRVVEKTIDKRASFAFDTVAEDIEIPSFLRQKTKKPRK